MKKRSIKNKNMKMDLLLMNCFDFTYAGKCHVFIHKRKDKYELVVTGVHFVDDIFAFAPSYKYKHCFDKLYYAILGFQAVIRSLFNSMDWYSPELFETDKIYDELFIKD